MTLHRIPRDLPTSSGRLQEFSEPTLARRLKLKIVAQFEAGPSQPSAKTFTPWHPSSAVTLLQINMEVEGGPLTDDPL